MKISELRALLDRISSEDMKEILVEVYRALPKKTREDLAIDEPLKSPGVARATAEQAKALARSVETAHLVPFGNLLVMMKPQSLQFHSVRRFGEKAFRP